jgi:DNA-binding transcriptional regulator YiaG
MKLRLAREMACLSVDYCADYCGVSASAWRYWENDQKQPNQENLKSIFLLFRGAVEPNDFHPIHVWQSLLHEQTAASK